MKISNIFKPIRIERNVIKNGKMYTQTWKGDSLLSETEVLNAHGGFTGLCKPYKEQRIVRKRLDLNTDKDKPATLGGV